MSHFNSFTVYDRRPAVTDCRLAERNREEQSMAEKSIAESAERALKGEHSEQRELNIIIKEIIPIHNTKPPVYLSLVSKWFLFII